MEVEEEKTSIPLEESTTAAVTKDRLLESNSGNDREVEKEPSESNTQGEESSVMVSKLDDPKPFVTVAVAVAVRGIGEEKEVIQCRDSELGGTGDSAVLESTNMLKDEKDGGEGAVKDEIPTSNVAAVECVGSELSHSGKVDDGEFEAAVIVRDNGGSVAEENVKNSEEGPKTSGSSVIEKDKDGVVVEKDEDGGEGEMETLKEVDDAEALKDGGECEASVIVRDKGGSVAEENAKNIGEGAYTSGSLVIVKDKDGVEGEMETLKEVDDADAMKDGGECEASVVVRDNGGSVAEENVKNSREGANTSGSLVTEKDKEGVEVEMETLKEVDDTEALKDGGGVDVPLLPVADNGEREEAMTDVKSAGCLDTQKENVETMQVDEAVTEGLDDVQEGVAAEVVKEEFVADEEEAVADAEEFVADEEEAVGVAEEFVADEEEAVGVAEDVKDEGKMADEEKVVAVMENDEQEAIVADEEKSLDTELETEEEATMADEEKVPDANMVVETELPESSVKSSGGKRKRGGKNSKTTPKSLAAQRKMVEEDVCFICFDGGDLVLCDRRNCPKAYHPSCVNRDAAFFQTKGQWNCGWHLCSICEKKAEYMCYTCTFSLCKACIKTNVILCVREKEKKGFCEVCMKTVMLIEKNSQENQGNVDFDDKSSWEYLFKDYWIETKAKFNLSLAELVEAKNAWKGSELPGKQVSLAAQSDVKDHGGSGSENPSENLEVRKSRTRRAKKFKSAAQEEDVNGGAAAAGSEGTSGPRNSEWASKELLEFVMHMRNGNKSIISQFDVQALLLEYIKANNLRDSSRKSQIVCDARLQRLFGKPRVGHFEMLKLLESHFLIKEDPQIDDIQGSVVDTEVSQVDDDEANETPAKGGKDKRRKMRKKGDRGPQSNREDYAAIDIHNISMIYLRRKLVEDLLDDTETFHGKIVGTFVRIRILGAHHKHDIYRLVQVTGTTKAAPYTIGKKTTDSMLEILNLDKTESISIDTISNQDFTEDECKRLRQSIKCGLINRLTVGDVLDKAMELQAARVNDWLETEVMRLSHLRDRASDLGRKKELRECVEKLQVLKRPEERARRLEEFPVIHADSTMDPNYGSEDDTDTDDKKQDVYKSSAGSRFSTRRDYPLKESWSGTGTPRSSGKNHEFTRNPSNRSFSIKVKDTTSAHFEPPNENLWGQGRDTTVQLSSILKKPSSANDDVASPHNASEAAQKVNETEKMWHYKDPSGKIQGPFSMVQLRKWSNNKYFPADLRIWRKSEKEDNAVLLTDALEGRFGQNSRVNWAATSVEIPKPSPGGRHGFANLPSPSPTPNRSGVGLGGGEGLLSTTPNGVQPATSLVVGGNNEPNAMGSFGVSVAAAPQNSEQHLVAPPINNMPPQMVQPLAGPHGWNGGPHQNQHPSPSSNVSGPQQLAYNHWGSVPNMLQNPAGNFLPPSPVGLQQPSASVGLRQPPPPPPLQPNVSWGTMPANPNMGCVGPTPGNQGMNWGPTFQGPQLTGNVNNPPWVSQAGAGNVHPGLVPEPRAQVVALNQGWVADPGPGPIQGPIVSGSGNPNWVAPPGNQGVPPNPDGVAFAGNLGPTSTTTGWVGGPGNQGAPTVLAHGAPHANMNQGWASLVARNQAVWDGSEQYQQHNQIGLSGQKWNRGSQGGFGGNRRHSDKPGSFNNRGGSRDSPRPSEH